MSEEERVARAVRETLQGDGEVVVRERTADEEREAARRRREREPTQELVAKWVEETKALRSEIEERVRQLERTAASRTHEEFREDARQLYAAYLDKNPIVRRNVEANALALVATHSARLLEREFADEAYDEEAREVTLYAFASRWSRECAESPFSLLKYEALLWPERSREHERVLDEATHEWLREQARRYLSTLDDSVPGASLLQAHWQRLVDGELPFGYRRVEERDMPLHEYALSDLLKQTTDSLFHLNEVEMAWLRDRATRVLPRVREHTSEEHCERLEKWARGECVPPFNS